LEVFVCNVIGRISIFNLVFDPPLNRLSLPILWRWIASVDIRNENGLSKTGRHVKRVGSNQWIEQVSLLRSIAYRR